jgi:hypothetical protein
MKLNLDIIVYDLQSITTSTTYTFVYDKACYSVSGGGYFFQPIFLTSVMFGFIGFASTQTQSVMYF